MNLSRLGRFLCGRHDAVLAVAADGRALGFGLLWVLGAALARRYDRADLMTEPHHLGAPLLVSTLNGTLLFLLLWACFLRKTADRPSIAQCYRVFLGLFWMTGPLAWLYAVPVERFLGSYDAAVVNLWFLAVVATWRVLLYTRFVSVLLGIGFFRAFFPVMLFSDVVAVAFAVLSPKPIWALMGGLMHSPEDVLILDVGLMVMLLGTYSSVVWLVGSVPASRTAEPRWRVPTSRQGGKATDWLWPVLGLLMWLPILPFTQAEQRRAGELDALLAAGRIDDAARFMAARAIDTLPPHVNPRPSFWPGKTTPSAWPVLAALKAHGADETWLALYREKCRRELHSAGPRLPHPSIEDPDTLRFMVDLVGVWPDLDAAMAKKLLTTPEQEQERAAWPDLLRQRLQDRIHALEAQGEDGVGDAADQADRSPSSNPSAKM